MSSNLEKILHSIIKNLAEPFVSEADFKFSLAWELKNKLRDTSQIILEFPVKSNNEKYIYVDICVKEERKISFIELKYKTKKQTINRYGESLNLKNQAAQNLGRYFFLRDVERLEWLKDKYGNSQNFSILLTNDNNYSEKEQKDTIDVNFLLSENKILTGTLKWNNENKLNQWTQKYDSIKLKNKYICKWNNAISGFRYVLLKV